MYIYIYILSIRRLPMNMVNPILNLPGMVLVQARNMVVLDGFGIAS